MIAVLNIIGNKTDTMTTYIINYKDLQNVGMTHRLALPTLVALCSIALNKTTLGSLVILGEIGITGNGLKVDELTTRFKPV